MITLNVIAKNHIRLQIMKILQIFTDDMLSTAVYQPLSSLQVRHKQIPHNQISTLLTTKPPVS